MKKRAIIVKKKTITFCSESDSPARLPRREPKYMTEEQGEIGA